MGLVFFMELLSKLKRERKRLIFLNISFEMHISLLCYDANMDCKCLTICRVALLASIDHTKIPLLICHQTLSKKCCVLHYGGPTESMRKLHRRFNCTLSKLSLNNVVQGLLRTY